MPASIVKAALFATHLRFAQAQTEYGDSLLPFDSFLELHSRSYQQGSAEFEKRRTLYEQRVADAEKHNSHPARKWTAGVNKLWDWTDAELSTLRGWDGAMRPDGGSVRSARPHSSFLQQSKDFPKEKIWDKLGMSSHVKDQKNCGSCWAIASASALEGNAEIFSGKYTKFSAQQIVSCTPNPRHCGGDGGCKGATAELAMDWVMKNGVVEENVIPYEGHDERCSTGSGIGDMTALFSSDDSKKGGASIGMTGWETLPKNEYAPLMQALIERGPVAVSVAADAWFSYDNGIFNGCGKDAVIDHAVVAMGFGEADNQKYWVIQNSWGADWGEKGHIRLERHDKEEYCGMNNDPQKGVACQGETEAVPVCGMCGVLFDSVVPHFGVAKA